MTEADKAYWDDFKKIITKTHDAVIRIDTEITHVKEDVQGHKDTLYEPEIGLVYKVRDLKDQKDEVELIRKDLSSMAKAQVKAAWALVATVVGGVIAFLLNRN